MKKKLLITMCLAALTFCSCKTETIKNNFPDFSLGMDKQEVIQKLKEEGCGLVDVVQPRINPDVYNVNGVYNIVTADMYFWASDSKEQCRFYFTEDDKLECISACVCYKLADSQKKIARMYNAGYKKCKEKIAEYIATESSEKFTVKESSKEPDLHNLRMALRETEYRSDNTYFNVCLEGDLMLTVYYGSVKHN